MSGRTLVASQPKDRPRFTPPQFQAEVEATLWNVIANLWRLGLRRRELALEKDALDVRIDDHNIRLQTHPDHPNIERRWRFYGKELHRCYELQSAVDTIDVKAERLQDQAARHFDRLLPRRQQELRKGEGWGPEMTGERIAAEMWKRAREDGPWMAGECPF